MAVKLRGSTTIDLSADTDRVGAVRNGASSRSRSPRRSVGTTPESKQSGKGGSVLTATSRPIADTNAWLQDLDDLGFAVISDFLAEAEQKQELALFNEMMLECCPNFDPDDRTTWTNKNMPGLSGKAIQGTTNNMAHSDWMWYLRTLPKLRLMFSHVHACPVDDLCVSFDGFSLDWSSKNKSEPWLHEDINLSLPLPNGLKSVQGIYTATAVKDFTRGFACVPGSHKHAEYRHNQRLTSGVVVPNRHYVPFGDNAPLPSKILVDANSFILFDSAVLHQNSGGVQDTDHGWNRRAAFLCMMPNMYRAGGVYQQKIDAYIEGAKTSHWAIWCERSKKPRWSRSRHNLLELSDYPIKRLEGQTPALTIPQERLVLF